MRGGGLPLHFGPAFLITGKAQTAVHFPPRGQAGFRLQPCCKGRWNSPASWVILALERSCPTRPAACQVDPDVSCALFQAAARPGPSGPGDRRSSSL